MYIGTELHCTCGSLNTPCQGKCHHALYSVALWNQLSVSNLHCTDVNINKNELSIQKVASNKDEKSSRAE